MLILFLMLLSASGELLPPDPTAELYFNQSLDHFGSDQRRFQQKYLIYDAAYKPGGPVFMCPGGESPVYGGYYHNQLMWALGDPLHALYLFPEHRFYGSTLPAGPVDSYKPGTIEFLRIEQALEDYMVILRAVRQQYNVSASQPTIVFGGSYPGELAAFLRVAYPKEILGALAASAPVLYHQGLQPPVASNAFFQVVTEDMALVDKNCPLLVQQAFTELYALSSTQQGRDTASSRLGLCTPFTDDQDGLRLVMLWAENAFAIMAMMDYPYSIGGMAPNPFELVCVAMASEGDLLTNLRYALGVSYNYTEPYVPCFNISEEYYKCADITGCGGGDGDPNALSWDYQSCTQIVSNIDTLNTTDCFPPAPYNYSYIQDYCRQRWNATPDPTGIPTKYNISADTASNIIFSNGGLDPWTPGGILRNLSSSLISLIIPDAAHHLDLHGPDPADPPAVRAARLQERDIIYGWLKQWADTGMKVEV